MALTKEERKAKKEAKKLEKMRAEAEVRRKKKRAELQREIAAQAQKRGELDKTWKELMLKIKEPLFRQDIQVMFHVFERALDKKDHLVNHIIRLMEVADDQVARTVASFCDTVDSMINKFLADLEAMSDDNARRTTALLKQGEDEAEGIAVSHDAAETHLQLLLFQGHATADQSAWAARGDNLVKEDEERSKCSDIRESLRSFLENEYNATWDEYKAVLRAYVTGTADNQKRVRKLRRKENSMADIIAAQAKRIANSDGLLRRLRSEYASYESGAKQAVFRERRERHRAACARLKRRLGGGCATDARRLDALVRETDEAEQRLREGCGKGDRVLRLAGLCRKLETLKEKVMPFGGGCPRSPSLSEQDVRRQRSDDSLVANAMSSMSGLTRLWQRISAADLTRRALLREKILLQRENAALARHLEDDDENKLEPTSESCVCSSKGRVVYEARPVAVEGVLEVSKYDHDQ